MLKDNEGLPLKVPAYVGSKGTKEATRKTIEKMNNTIRFATVNNLAVNWSRVAMPPQDVFKHLRYKKASH